VPQITSHGRAVFLAKAVAIDIDVANDLPLNRIVIIVGQAVAVFVDVRVVADLGSVGADCCVRVVAVICEPQVSLDGFA